MIPTAKNLLSNETNRVAFPFIDDLIADKDAKAESILHCMNEFAKIHVTAALEAALEEATNSDLNAGQLDKIKNAYPLTNII